MEYSHHLLIPLSGIAVAGLALLGAIAAGPYGRRGVRATLATVSCLALVGSVAWGVVYLGMIEQRRAIETRLSELRAQAMGAGSALACLERADEVVARACEQTLFAAPEVLAAANFYTAARFEVLTAAARYSGPRTPQFDEAVATLTRSLQQDPFGLTANALVLRTGCRAERCDTTMFPDPRRLRENIRQKTYEANVARHAAGWQAGAPKIGSAPATTIIPGGSAAAAAPIPDKYTLPSAASIPPVSIMDEEPPQRPQAPERPTRAAQPAPAQPSATAPAALQPAAPPAQKQPVRKQNAPLSIKPSP